MNAFGPDEGLDGQHSDADIDKQFAGVRKARKVSLKIQLALLGLFLLTLLALVGVGYLLFQSWQETERERATTAVVQEEKQEIAQEAQKALCGTAEREIYDRDLCAKWTELAKQPAPDVEIVDVSREEIVDAFRAYCEAGNCRGVNGRTPTPDEVAAAFARFCADGNCRGEDGQDAPPAEPGKDGRDGVDGQDAPPPTAEMMLAAVTTYCSDGRCVGATGADGKEGPPPSAEAIAQAVAAFCANDACRGPAGADSVVPGPIGQTGQAGPPGRGIASVQCDSPTPFSFNVTYSDGTTEAIQCGGGSPDPLEELIGP